MTHQSDNGTPTPTGDAWTPFGSEYSDLTPDQLRFLVEKAHQQRSAYMADMFKRWFREWRSVFRRPGRLVPHGGGAQPQAH